jgi:hypothetical protein
VILDFDISEEDSQEWVEQESKGGLSDLLKVLGIVELD